MEHWRLIRSEPMSGAWNMAIDEVLLDEVAQGRSAPVLRLYRWTPAAVTLGYGQRGLRQVDSEACRRRAIDVVRRITGGRAVLHDREVTYAVVAPESTPPFSEGILQNYHVIAAALLDAYSRLGVKGTLEPGRRRSDYPRDAANVCFAAPSSYEIVRDGRKLTGSAQKRRGGAFLQHGSLPLDVDLDLLWEVLTPHSKDRDRLQAGREVLKRTVDWINRLREQPITYQQVEEALISSFSERLAVDLREDALNKQEWAHVRRLIAEKSGRDSE